MIRLVNRRGSMLTELVIVLLMMGVVGASMTGMMVSHSRFFAVQDGQATARQVARAGVSMLLADLRMVESGGIVAAAPDSFSALVPYSVGVICSNAGGITTATMEPVDSVVFAEAGHSGYAYIDSLNAIHYVTPGSAVTIGTPATCILQSVDTIPRGRVIAIGGNPPGANPGSPILLLQRLTYKIRPSTLVPGRLGLYRAIVSKNSLEELAAPFDSAATFRYFTAPLGGPVANPSPLSAVTGIQTELVGFSERAGAGAPNNQRAPLVTSVFFQNR